MKTITIISTCTSICALRTATVINFLITILMTLNTVFAQVDQISNGTEVPFCQVPASPAATIVTQPNGEELNIRIIGNGYVHYLETADGYVIKEDSNDGYYKYLVEGDRGELLLTNVKASNTQNRSAAENAVLSTTKRNLRYTGEALKKRVELSEQSKSSANRTAPSTGTQRALLLLIDFSDQPSDYSVSEFDDLANQPGYSVNGQSGSFRDYYSDVSYGNLIIDTDVRGWYRAALNKGFYGAVNGNSNDSYPRLLVREAVDAAEADGVNFSDYDGDNDGEVDVVMVIHSGRGQEESGVGDDIWSHRWVLGALNVSYDGVLINDYIIQPEEYSSSNDIANIGVLCHEYGHALGLPDLYDIDQSSSGIGDWGLMASGTWNNQGRTPAQYSAYCKATLGWVNPIDLNGNVSINSVQSTSASQTVYRINSPSSNEYYLIANRQKVNWDDDIPDSGCLIWHIDENIQTNANENHPLVRLVQSDGDNDLGNGTNHGDNGDAFPGSSNNNVFNSSTIPDAYFYSGANAGFCLTNIAESGNEVSFDFSANCTTGGGGAHNILATNLTTDSSTYDQGGAISIDVDQGTDNPNGASVTSELEYTVRDNNGTVITVLGTDSSSLGNGDQVDGESLNTNLPSGLPSSCQVCAEANYDGGVTGDNPNDNLICVVINVNETLSTEENLLSDSIKLFPNPANQFFNIESGLTYDLQIEIYDLTGRQVIRDLVAANSRTQLNTEALSEGTYLVKMIGNKEGSTITKKLIIRH